jgi:anti-sigma factor RsiW
MNIPREVILDLLPVYMAGEASPATRAFVEEYLAQDPELAQRVRSQGEADLDRGLAAVSLPPELELRSLRRTRGLLGLQRWLFGFAIGFTAISLSTNVSITGHRITGAHLLIQDHPIPFGICVALAVGCWTGNALLRRRLRSTAG